MTDGEYFTDEPKNPIPPRHTWISLTSSQLIDLKIQLQNNMFGLQNPAIKKTLTESIDHIDSLLQKKSYL